MYNLPIELVEFLLYELSIHIILVRMHHNAVKTASIYSNINPIISIVI